MNRNQRRALAKSRDPQGLSQIAALHKSSGRIDKAEQAYRQAIARDPRCWEAHNNLGNLLLKAGRIGEAGRHFALACTVNPKNAVVVLNLAIGLSAQNHFKEAVPVYRKPSCSTRSMQKRTHGLPTRSRNSQSMTTPSVTIWKR